MHWTVPSIAGVVGLILVIVLLNVYDVFKPGYMRKGFLPMETNRGDRVFVSILVSIVVWFLWLKFFPDRSIAYTLAVNAPLVFVLMMWG
jgi:predicted small integral membrane protein